jgi:predicted lipoprotein with Yx(FWY)xxD motif
MTSTFHGIRRGALVATSAVAVALLATACSSSAKPGAAGTTAPTSAVTSSSPPAAATFSAPAAPATVETQSGALGTYLTTSTGITLYMFASDSGSTSSCTATCATAWPPLVASAAPSGASGVSSSLLGTITRSDGTTQVTYEGHPLYTFVKDAKVGDTDGQGSSAFGAKWWMMAPSGQPIEGSASSAPSAAPSSSSSAPGYTY